MRICLEKPTAVIFAHSPAVEMLMESDPAKSKLAEELWKYKDRTRHPPKVLSGRLDEWIRKSEVETDS